MKTDFNKFANSYGISSSVMNDYQNHINNSITPVVIDERKDNIAMIDVFSKLMSNRIIYLGTPIDDYIANVMSAQLLYLEHQQPKEEITIYINSPGGSVYAGLGIYDTMKFIECPISTINTGLAASMGAVLLAAGDNGNRKALKHSRTMIHQPLGGASGQASDIEITAREINKLKKELYSCLSDDTGVSVKKLMEDGDRDFWLTAAEAKKYGIVDDVLKNHNNKAFTRVKKVVKKESTKK